MSTDIRLFDAHCHLQDDRYGDGIGEVVNAAVDAGVEKLSVNGTHEADWDKVDVLTKRFPNHLIPNFGLHPWWVQDRSDAWLENLKAKLLEVPSAGLGECGLDKYRNDIVDMETQQSVFEAQLKLGKELERPVSVHCVKAFGDMLEILQRCGPFPHGVVMHSWTGPADIVKPFAKIEGVHFSLSGFSTRLSRTKFGALVNEIPLERLLLETDAPDALPKELRKKKDDSRDQLNYPINLHLILSSVATILGIEQKKIAEIAYQNAARLFKTL